MEVCLVGCGQRYRVALVLLAAGAVATCAAETPSPSALERARTQGLRAGFSIEPPYAFVDDRGEPTGEAPQTLHRVAGELGIETVQWFPIPFHDLIPALLAGRIDVVASGMFVTPERARRVRFSLPTVCVGPVLVIRDGHVRPGPSEPGTDRCDVCRIAVLQGSVEQRALEAEPRPDTELIALPDLTTAIQAVGVGSADALAISAPTAREVVRRDSDLAIEERGLSEHVSTVAGGCAAFAFRPEDAELAEASDSILREFLGSPAHLEMVERFGFTASELACGDRVSAASAAGAGPCAMGPEPE